MSDYFLVYASHASKEWSEDELLLLLDQSRSNNAKANVSGVLVYLKSRFFQVLEGDRWKILDLYEKIKNNPGHTDHIILLEGPLHDRNFSEWSMGFKKMGNSEFKELTGFDDIKKYIKQASNNQTALTFLKMFDLKAK